MKHIPIHSSQASSQSSSQANIYFLRNNKDFILFY